MKKLKEVTDRKKTSLLKDLDHRLTAAAGSLGFALEQRTARMAQRDRKVGARPVCLRPVCRPAGSSSRPSPGGFCPAPPPCTLQGPPRLSRARLAGFGAALSGQRTAGHKARCRCHGGHVTYTGISRSVRLPAAHFLRLRKAAWYVTSTLTSLTGGGLLTSARCSRGDQDRVPASEQCPSGGGMGADPSFAPVNVGPQPSPPHVCVSAYACSLSVVL